MKGEVENFRPSTTADRGSGALVLLAPDEHFSIVGRRCENCAEFGVCLLYRSERVSLDNVRYMPGLIFQPDDSLRIRTHSTHHTGPSWLCKFILAIERVWHIWAADGYSPFQCLNKFMRLAFDLEYLYCLVGGACRQSAAVIIKTGIVLEGGVKVRTTPW